MSKKKDNIFVLSVTLAIIAAVAAGILSCVDQVTKEPRKEAKLKQTIKALKELQPELTNNPVNEQFPKPAKGEKEQAKVVFYPAKKDGKLLTVIGKAVSPKGYGGDMTVMVGMSPDGKLQHVIVTANKETPGLGTVVVERKEKTTLKSLFEKSKKNENQLPPNPFLDQFDGKVYVQGSKETAAEEKDSARVSSTDFAVQKDEDVDQMTGATAKRKGNAYVPSTKFAVLKDGGVFDQVTGATISSRACTYGVKLIVSTYSEQKDAILKQFNAETEKK